MSLTIGKINGTIKLLETLEKIMIKIQNFLIKLIQFFYDKTNVINSYNTLS